MKLQFIQRYHADVTIGAKLTLDAGQSTKTMKEFKQEVKSANEDLLNMQRTFGATSKEALAAAKKVAELKDNIQDASETAKLFDPGNKFAVLGNAVRGLIGGFTALQGALALVGVEGEEVQKTLLKVQGALALTEGLNTVADVTKDFQRLGSVLVQTLGKNGAIGLAIAGVTALGLVLSGVFNRKQNDALNAYNDTLKDYTKAAGEARQKITEVRIAFEQATQGVITKDQSLKIYNDTLGDSLGKTNDINVAEKLLADKAETYIKITALKAQANALFAKSAEQTAKALVEQDKLTKNTITFFGSSGYKKELQEGIDLSIKGAKEIEDLGANLLRQAGQLSSQFGVTTGGSTGRTSPGSTPRAAAAKKEAEEIKLIYSTEQDNLLLIQQEKEQKFIDNKQKFIDEGKRLEQEEFDAKIALLNAEVDSEEVATRQKIALAELERDARIRAASEIGNALGALSELVGRETAAGKVLAIAEATINTYLAASNILKNTARNPVTGAIPGFAIAQMIATIAAGLITVRNIAKTKVPGTGSSGGGGSSAGASAPLQPQLPAATNTLLNQQQLNQIGNATVRAYVTETDIATNQERVRRLNRMARL